ncbi:MAG TPA: helix-hairpin-helix domain-containing protein [Bacteroidota bacterium]|nr:helix-hairpin-helix domain-containing protein [Bacteroidota bacterium]
MKRQSNKEAVLREFREIPGVGKSIAGDLWDLGLRSTSHLRNQNPERLYARFCRMQGKPVDRCLLYVFRCAVYFASHKRHDPNLLLWWNWKD